MKNKLFILAALLPLVIIPILFFVFDVDLSIFIVTMIFAIVLASMAIVFFVKSENSGSTQRKRRKILLINLSVFVAFLLIMTIIDYLNDGNLWQNFFSNIGMVLLFLQVIVISIYGFFRKDKDSAGKNDEVVEKK